MTFHDARPSATPMACCIDMADECADVPPWASVSLSRANAFSPPVTWVLGSGVRSKRTGPAAEQLNKVHMLNRTIC